MESVGSLVSRVILFGTIPTEIHIVPDIPADLPTTPELPTVSPFLCSDDSESEPVDELPERHVPYGSFSAMVSRWRAKVISRPSWPSRSSLPDTTIPSAKIPVILISTAPSTWIASASPACDIPTPVITASSAVRSHIRTTARKSTLGLRPVLTPARSAALRRARRIALSLETSSSSSSSYSASHTSESSFATSLYSAQTMLHLHLLHLVDHSFGGPSWKRRRSSATSIPSTVHTARALSSTRADLLPPHKRYMGTSAISDESSDEAAAIIDGLGIEPDTEVVETGFEPRLAVVKSESEHEEAEADDEADVENVIEQLEQLEEGVQGMYDHILEIPLQRIVDIETGQTDLQDRSLIIDGKRSSLLERVAALEGSNTSVRGALDVERSRADNLGFTATSGLYGGILMCNGIDEAYEMPWKDLMKLMIDVYCSGNEIQKLENDYKEDIQTCSFD
nr:hypothetical protein [Tanacetum cinerariifolium]